MGKASLDLPDPLHAEPSASAEGADELLSQIAGDEIERLLAEADVAVANDEDADDVPVPKAENASEKPAVERESAESAPRDGRTTAVSSFVADGDPALEAELDNLLSKLDPAATEQDSAASPSPQIPARAAAAPGTPGAGDGLPPKDQEQKPKGPDRAASTAETDAVLTDELDQVFDKMTASAHGAPTGNGAMPSASAKPAGSIDLLKVLDPIVASDAAAVRSAEAAAHEAPHTDEDQDEAPPLTGPAPFYVHILEWINSPLDWMSPEVRDAAGKIGILTLINAAAILLYVVFFRRK